MKAMCSRKSISSTGLTLWEARTDKNGRELLSCGKDIHLFTAQRFSLYRSPAHRSHGFNIFFTYFLSFSHYKGKGKGGGYKQYD